MKLNEAAHKYLRETKAPHKGLRMDVVSYPDSVAIRLYRQNFETFSTGQQQDLSLWIESLMSNLNRLNIIKNVVIEVQ